MDFNGQLSPSQTTSLLRSIGHLPVKKLGQNFLIDANIVRKSLELAEVKKGDFVVEVGPGLGTLTGALLREGANVYAVELDKRLHAHIADTFKDCPNLNLIWGDAVEYPLAALPQEAKNYKIVANLPYAISTIWLEKVLSGNLPQKMSLMLQKEAAMRFTAKNSSSEFSPISIFLNSAYRVKCAHKVSASCFHPRPNVDSVLLALEILETPFVFKGETKELIRKIFSRRRKQIFSILKDLQNERALEWLENTPEIKPSDRPETIAPELWRKLDR